MAVVVVVGGVVRTGVPYPEEMASPAVGSLQNQFLDGFRLTRRAVMRGRDAAGWGKSITRSLNWRQFDGLVRWLTNATGISRIDSRCKWD